jgi:hypothetical protein
MVEPHPDQENDEVTLYICRVTAPLDVQGQPSSATLVAISMILQGWLAP